MGTSGWSYPEWKKDLYQGVRQSGWLSRYAEVFSTVEVNMTFRRGLAEPTASRWVAATPADFRFAVKAHQRLTHFTRLADPTLLGDFLSGLETLGSKLGPVLFQLPPDFSRNDQRLRVFCQQLPAGLSSAFEFRHPSWFHPEVAALLARHNASLVVADPAPAPPPKRFPDQALVYVRLRQPAYTQQELASWVSRIRGYPADTAWVFVKHGSHAAGWANNLVELFAT